jgi:hypothetical protein
LRFEDGTLAITAKEKWEVLNFEKRCAAPDLLFAPDMVDLARDARSSGRN